MDNENRIQLFENKKIRTAWDEENETWYFSIVDVISVLTDSSQSRRYWSDLKIKLKNEGNETYDKIVQLKMTVADGKKRMTDVANTEELLRTLLPAKIATSTLTKINSISNPFGEKVNFYFLDSFWSAKKSIAVEGNYSSS